MICTGNICRSTMAHHVLEQRAAELGINVEVDSAGISNEEQGHLMDRRAARVLTEAGYEVTGHRARQVQAGELAEWDLVLAATDYHLRSLNRLRATAGLSQYDSERYPNMPEIRMFRDFDPQAQGNDRDLPDPWYGNYDDFVDTLEVIERSLPALADHIRRRDCEYHESGR